MSELTDEQIDKCWENLDGYNLVKGLPITMIQSTLRRNFAYEIERLLATQSAKQNPVAQEVTQQAAKAETGSVQETTDALYLDVMNIPCDESKANEEYSDRRIAYKHGHRDARHAAADLIAEAASGFREGRNAQPESSDLAPTTSTASASGALAHVGTLSVFEDKEATFGYAYDISTNMAGHQLLQTLDGAELYVAKPGALAAPDDVRNEALEEAALAVEDEVPCTCCFSDDEVALAASLAEKIRAKKSKSAASTDTGSAA